MGQAPSDQLAITVPVVAVSRVVQGAEGAPRVEALEHHAGARRVAMQSSVNSVDALVAPVVVISCSASGSVVPQATRLQNSRGDGDHGAWAINGPLSMVKTGQSRWVTGTSRRLILRPDGPRPQPSKLVTEPENRCCPIVDAGRQPLESHRPRAPWAGIG